MAFADLEVEGVVELDFDGVKLRWSDLGEAKKGYRRRGRFGIARAEKQFTYGRCSVDACYQSRTRAITVVILQQEVSSLLIQGRFGVRIDQ